MSHDFDFHSLRHEVNIHLQGRFLYHTEHGVLCLGHRFGGSFDGFSTFYDPVIFKNYEAAEKFKNSGCIAEIQETFNNLNVRFTKNIYTYTPRSDGVES